MEKQKSNFNWKSFWELVRFGVIAIIIVIPIRMFIAQPFIVSGSSMVPTFQDGQYLVVDEISYIVGTPKRDDVVVFRDPNNTKIYFIKRIIGLPGETVNVNSGLNEVTIINNEHPEGFKLDQSFITNTGGIDGHMVLGQNEYYVMGDNRPASSDSRYWGAVPRKLIVGRAFLRLFPFKEIGISPGDYKDANS